jgi:hypothetical protein
MKMRLTQLTAALITGLVLATGVSHATESPDLAGTWKTPSLTQNKFGYAMKLKETNAGYAGTLQFSHKFNGKSRPLTVQLTRGAARPGGYRVTMNVNGKGSVTGILSTTDGSLFFPTCYRTLPSTMRNNAATDCMFQQMPTR